MWTIDICSSLNKYIPKINLEISENKTERIKAKDSNKKKTEPLKASHEALSSHKMKDISTYDNESKRKECLSRDYMGSDSISSKGSHQRNSSMDKRFDKEDELKKCMSHDSRKTNFMKAGKARSLSVDKRFDKEDELKKRMSHDSRKTNFMKAGKARSLSVNKRFDKEDELKKCGTRDSRKTNFMKGEKARSLPEDKRFDKEDELKKCMSHDSRNTNFMKAGKARSLSVGLKNSGNSCYINAVIQCLYAIPELREMKPKKEANRLVLEFEKLFKELGSNKKAIGTERIEKEIQKISNKFANYRQQDAHSFMLFLLKEVEENCKQSTGNEFKDLFAGTRKINTEFLCNEKHKENVLERIFTFPIPVRGEEKIEQLFEDPYILATYNDQTVKWCQKCQKMLKAEESIKLTFLPKYLILLLNRYNSETTEKDFSAVKVSETIELNPDHQKFNLFAMCEHIGRSSHYGHYIAVVKDINGDRSWYKYCDDRVIQVEFRERNTDAYMLFYKKQPE